MATTRAQKENQLAYLQDRFPRMKAAVFAGYRGMTVASIAKLRKLLRDQGVDYKVAKKTLMEKAAEHAKIEGFNTQGIDGPVAVAMSYTDEVTAAKVLKTFTAEDKNLMIYGGIMNGKMLDKSAVMTLANLPSMDELRAKLLGSMMAPISGFARVAIGPLSGFVRVLGALAKKAQ